MLLHYIIDLLIHTAVWAVCLMLVNGLAVAVASVARGTATLDGIGDWRIVAARVSLCTVVSRICKGHSIHTLSK